MPKVLQGKSLEEIQLGAGMAISARRGCVLEESYCPPVTYERHAQGYIVDEHWHTPYGSLHRRSESNAEDYALGIQPRTVKYPITQPEHYHTYQSIVEHLRYRPNYEAFARYDAQVGEYGLPMVILGSCPAHDLMLNWIGYEQAFYDLVDVPEAIEQAIYAGNAAYEKMWPIVAESQCRLIMHGVNFDSRITSPSLFEQHFMPYLKAFNETMHRAGKWTAFHGDGDQSQLLDKLLVCGYDVADCLAVEPMGGLSIEHALEAWNNQIVIWGGLPSPLLEPMTLETTFNAHIERLENAIKGNPCFILGIADQAMPAALWRRIKTIGRFMAHQDKGEPYRYDR